MCKKHEGSSEPAVRPTTVSWPIDVDQIAPNGVIDATGMRVLVDAYNELVLRANKEDSVLRTSLDKANAGDPVYTVSETEVMAKNPDPKGRQRPLGVAVDDALPGQYVYVKRSEIGWQ